MIICTIKLMRGRIMWNGDREGTRTWWTTIYMCIFLFEDYLLSYASYSLYLSTNWSCKQLLLCFLYAIINSYSYVSFSFLQFTSLKRPNHKIRPPFGFLFLLLSRNNFTTFAAKIPYIKNVIEIAASCEIYGFGGFALNIKIDI